MVTLQRLEVPVLNGVPAGRHRVNVRLRAQQ
jgi:hypothetical protein